MTAVAFSIPGATGWRWRIVNDGGETVQESHSMFATLPLALDEGRERLREHAEQTAPLLRRPPLQRQRSPWRSPTART
jgi:hypothetical protein